MAPYPHMFCDQNELASQQASGALAPPVNGEFDDRVAARWEAQLADVVRLGQEAGVQVWSCESEAQAASVVAGQAGIEHVVVSLPLPYAQILAIGFQPSCRPVASLIAELATSRAVAFSEALRAEELARDQSLLLEELNANWKSLDALSEIGSRLKDGSNPAQLAADLFKKAAQLQEGLHLGVWMLEGGSLEPLILPGTEPFFPGPQWSLFVSKSIADEKPFVLNGRRRITARQFEAPITAASHVAIVPIRAADGTQGALSFWRYEHGRNFDDHLVRMMQAVAVQVAIVLENEHLSRVRAEADKLRHELAIGSEIQQLLLVSPPPADLAGMSAAVISIPSTRVDGDFYDFIPQADGSLALLIGDVMGKGVQAALVGAATKISFLKQMGLLAVSRAGGELPTACDVMFGAAQNLTNRLTQLETFVCVCYAHFDGRTNRLEFVNCGYPRILHFSAATGNCVVLDNGYLPLGFGEPETYHTYSIPYQPGDVFLLCSDGLTEARSVTGEMFGEDRVRECLQRYFELHPSELLDAIRNEVIVFSESQVFADDLTCVAIRIENTPPGVVTHEVCRIWRAECEELPALRDWITETLARFDVKGVDDDAVWEIHLATTEAFSNIARHARPDDGTVQLEMSLSDSSLQIRMKYRGCPFNAPHVQEPPSDLSREGGFGLFLMSNLMDECEHKQISEGMNQITMSKSLRKQSKEL